MIYLQLFLSFLQIGMFSFGGGYAAMPLIQGQLSPVQNVDLTAVKHLHAVQLPEPRLLDPTTLYKLVPRLLDRAVTLLGIARIRHDTLSGNGRINSQEYLEGILGKMPCHA